MCTLFQSTCRLSSSLVRYFTVVGNRLSEIWVSSFGSKVEKLVECKLNKGFFFFLLPQFCSTPCIMHNYVFNVCIPSNYYLMSHDCTIIISVMEFPACFLVIILLLKAGRRLTLLILYLICGFSLLATMAIPEYVLSNNRV